MKFGKMPGSGAKNGFAPYDKKTEGDDRVPTGIFKIGTTFGYERKIRTRMPYKQATDLDFWIDDSNSEKYNTWVRIPHKGDVPRDSAGRIISHERMKRRDHLYHYGFVVDYNTDPVVRGKGSAIFFHWELTAGAPTFGCIATSRDNLVAILKWLDPDKMPVVVLGTQSDLKSNRIH